MMTTTQQPDSKPGAYYVSVIRNGSFEDARLVSGPYPKHQQALALVDKARDIAEKLDARAAWYAFGTVRLAPEFNEPGTLQKWGYSLTLKRN